MRETFATPEVLPMTTEMVELAGRYLAQKVVPVDFTDDARQVALCSVTRLDYLVSGNFKHLANVRRESGFNAVNILQGYPPVHCGTHLPHPWPRRKRPLMPWRRRDAGGGRRAGC